METPKNGKFPNLEIISSSGRSSSDTPHSENSHSATPRGSHRELRSLPRLSLSSEQFRHTVTGKIFSVSDLSKKGMGFWLFDPTDLRLFAVGGELEGTLNLKREKYAVQARIRNLSSDRIGCEFEKLSPVFLDALQLFLAPSTLGAELKLLPSVELHTLWYHGPSGTDLLIRHGADGGVQRIALYVLGNFVQWDEKEGLVSGSTAPSPSHSEVRGIHRLESHYFYPDTTLDPEKLEIAKTVVLSSNLPLELKNKCVLQWGQ